MLTLYKSSAQNARNGNAKRNKNENNNMVLARANVGYAIEPIVMSEVGIKRRKEERTSW